MYGEQDIVMISIPPLLEDGVEDMKGQQLSAGHGYYFTQSGIVSEDIGIFSEESVDQWMARKRGNVPIEGHKFGFVKANFHFIDGLDIGKHTPSSFGYYFGMSRTFRNEPELFWGKKNWQKIVQARKREIKSPNDLVYEKPDAVGVTPTGDSNGLTVGTRVINTPSSSERQPTSKSISPSLQKSSLNWKNFKYHPSIRYMVLSEMLKSENKDQVKIEFSGKLDTLLYQVYVSGLGREPGENIKECGINGRVYLVFDTKSGQSTKVDLGGRLDTGYVVEAIEDPLGVFPEGTVNGDFLDLDVVKQIVLAQGQRDRIG